LRVTLRLSLTIQIRRADEFLPIFFGAAKSRLAYRYLPPLISVACIGCLGWARGAQGMGAFHAPSLCTGHLCWSAKTIAQLNAI
jgi:hypothetical protein